MATNTKTDITKNETVKAKKGRPAANTKAPDVTGTPVPEPKPLPPAKKLRIPGPVNPYDLILVGFDSHPDVSAKAEDELARVIYTQLFDERVNLPLDANKLAMTRAYGVTQELKAVQYRDRWYVVDGRRRTLYARKVWDEQAEAGVKEEQRIAVPVTEYTGDIARAFAASRSLNVHEESSPMMRAREMNRLLMETISDPETGKDRKRTVIEVATVFGVSDQTVRNMQKLFESSDTVKKALTELKQPTIGLLIADLSEQQQMEVLSELKAEQAGGKKVTVAGAQAKVQEKKGKQSMTAKDKLDKLELALTRCADGWDGTKRPKSEKEQVKALLECMDALNRVVFYGKHAFPTPIKDQPLGYTLEFIANLGD